MIDFVHLSVDMKIGRSQDLGTCGNSLCHQIDKINEKLVFLLQIAQDGPQALQIVLSLATPIDHTHK